MKKNCSFFLLISLLVTAFLTSCNNPHPGYKKTEDGLYYKFYIHNASAKKPKMTDFLRVGMACYLNEELYYDWQEMDGVYSQLTPPAFPGDLQSAYAMMNLGDSASFYIKADSVAIHYYDKDPQQVGLKPEDYFRYEIKLREIVPEEKFLASVDRMKEKLMQESKEQFEAYIQENNINVKPLESGVYIVTTEKGKGRCPVKGERVVLDFDSKLLDGTSLGSTFEKKEKFTFVLGEGYVIPGWEEIVPHMHLGERVTAIIPFEMAYGEVSISDIPPYANLVYDIKLLEIMPADTPDNTK